MIENIYSQLKHHSDIYRFTASGPSARLLSVCGLSIFLLLHMSCGWLQDCTSGRSINVAAEQTDGMTDLRFTKLSHWTLLWQQFGTDFTAPCCAVLWLKGVAINWLQILKINLLPKWPVQKNKPYCCYCRPVKPVPLQHLYVSTDSTVSFGRR